MQAIRATTGTARSARARREGESDMKDIWGYLPKYAKRLATPMPGETREQADARARFTILDGLVRENPDGSNRSVPAELTVVQGKSDTTPKRAKARVTVYRVGSGIREILRIAAVTGAPAATVAADLGHKPVDPA